MKRHYAGRIFNFDGTENFCGELDWPRWQLVREAARKATDLANSDSVDWDLLDNANNQFEALLEELGDEILLGLINEDIAFSTDAHLYGEEVEFGFGDTKEEALNNLFNVKEQMLK